jgi:hypothetical protein
VRIHGEDYHDYLVLDDVAMTTDEWVERLADHLEDFIAESRFGWGTRRERRVRPTAGE